MEFTCVQLLISLIIYCSTTTTSYLLHFPNDNRNNFGQSQNMEKYQHTRYNIERSDNIEKNENWQGWNMDSENEKLYKNKLDENENPEEKLIKFQVLDDPPPYQHRRPNKLNHDYYNDIYWPKRYTSDFNKNTSWNTHPYHYHPVSNTQHQYHWENLKPIEQYYHKPSNLNSNSLNFGLGGTTSHSIGSSNSGSTIVNEAHKPVSFTKSSSSKNTYIQNRPSFLTNEMDTSNRKHSNNDIYHPPSPAEQYHRKRYRLEIHPGLIAAPIAGLAAFGAVSVFTANPILLELGLVKHNEYKKPESIRPSSSPYPPHHHHHHHHYSQGWSAVTTHRPYSTYPHSHYPESPSTEYPVLLPPNHMDKPILGKPWWSPFAAMIPRFKNLELHAAEKERD